MLSISALIPYRKAAWITIQRSLSTTRPFVGSKDKDKQKHVNVKPGGSETRRKTQRQHQQERPSPHATNLGEKGETTPSKIYSQFKQPAAPPTKMGHQHSQDKEQTKNKRSNSSSKRTKAKQQHQDVFVTPGAPVTTPFYYNHNNTGLSSGSGTFRMTRVLSTLNASALFANGDKHRKRNRNTRESLLTVLREQVLMRRHRNAYALAGHGVPVQVLQDHINMADTLLAREEHAAECSFNNFHGDLNFDWMRVRGRDGTNRASPWPNKASSESLTSSMELYLTVMNRLATTLGMVLTSDEDDADEHHAAATKALSISHWNVDILRGLAYPPQLLPSTSAATSGTSNESQQQDRRILAPIIEWMPRNGISAPGHVCIRVQGFISAPDSNLEVPASRRRKKRLPVTLVFDACFRNKAE